MTRLRKNRRGLALAPGLLFFTFFLPGCDQQSSVPLDDMLCHSAVTPIREIQGTGYHSPLLGSRQVVTGAVTFIEPGSGFFIEAPGDGRPGDASRALFVAHPGDTHDLEVGQQIAAVGKVAELGERRNTLTALTGIERMARCESALPMPLTFAELPLDNQQREALEGMRLLFADGLAVADVYLQYRGKITLSSDANLRVPTEDIAPGPGTANATRNSWKWTIEARPRAAQPLAVGSRFRIASGVLGHEDGRPVLQLEPTEVEWLEPPPTPPSPGSIRVVNANLLNYFNGDGRGGGFPTARGAENAGELKQQETRLAAALAALQPDLLAVQELENDGYGPHSAARSLETLLEQGGNGDFQVIANSENRLGGDVISVGLLYRTAALSPVGSAHTLGSEPFRHHSRQPLAQLFRERASGELVLVAVNHLKSKGSCPDDGPNADQDDGQGCWNPARVDAVKALLPWLHGLAMAAGTDHILVLGDMNAYRMEDPVRAFRDGNYVELVENRSGLPQYSYRRFGRAGTLDYAFATPALADRALRAYIWHINSDWPQRMALPQPWLRMSDHDPVVVDLQFPSPP